MPNRTSPLFQSPMCIEPANEAWGHAPNFTKPAESDTALAPLELV
jgi:hypothetical protein